jgi:hypothetical protein
LACAKSANRILGQHPALTTVADRRDCRGQLIHEPAGTVTVSLQQIERHALSGLLSDARQALQSLNELLQ